MASPSPFTSPTEGRLGECHALRLTAMRILAPALTRLGEPVEPALMLVQGIECARRQFGDEHVVSLGAMSAALPYFDRAGQWDRGETYARLASAGLGKYSGGHAVLTAVPDVYLARFASMQCRLDEAESMFASLLSGALDGCGDFVRARLHAFYGTHLARCGQFDRAEEQIQTAAAILGGPGLGGADTHPDDVVLAFIALYEAWGKPDEAEEYRRLRDQVLAAAPTG